MSDETLEKLARVDNGVATVNRLIIAAVANLSALPQTLDEFIRDPDEDNAAEVEKSFLACTAAIEGIRGYLTQVASDVLGVNNEPDVNGDINIQAMSDDEGIRLK